MSVASLPIIRNVKIHFNVCDKEKLEREIKLLEKSSNANVKSYHNFLVYKGQYTFIFFCTSGTVNITGIKQFEEIAIAVNFFCTQFNFCLEEIGEVVIDNSTASGSFGIPINLRNLKNELFRSIGSSVDVSLNPEYFPSVVCRSSGIGTCLVFANGKYCIVGAKCFEHVMRLFYRMDATILSI